MQDASNFGFWYRFVVQHLYPQLYHSCTFEYQRLVFADDDAVKGSSNMNTESKEMEQRTCVYNSGTSISVYVYTYV